ncbi:hypothetical protein, partial [Streptomyces sp. DSM 41636]
MKAADKSPLRRPPHARGGPTCIRGQDDSAEGVVLENGPVVERINLLDSEACEIASHLGPQAQGIYGGRHP